MCDAVLEFDSGALAQQLMRFASAWMLSCPALPCAALPCLASSSSLLLHMWSSPRTSHTMPQQCSAVHVLQCTTLPCTAPHHPALCSQQRHPAPHRTARCYHHPQRHCPALPAVTLLVGAPRKALNRLTLPTSPYLLNSAMMSSSLAVRGTLAKKSCTHRGGQGAGGEIRA